MWGLLAVAAALAVALLVVSANLDGYLSANSTWLTEQIQAALGRRVEFTRISIKWPGGPAVRVHDVTLSEDPAYGDTPFFDARGLDVRVRFLPALFGRIEIAGIVLDRPRLTIIKTPSGVNTASLGQTRAGESATLEGGDESGTAAALTSAGIAIHDGAVIYQDGPDPKASRIMLEHVHAYVDGIVADQPLAVRLQAELGRDRGLTLEAEGVVGPLDLRAPEDTQIDMEVAIDVAEAEQLVTMARAHGFAPSRWSVRGPLQVAANLSGVPGSLHWRGRLDGSELAITRDDTFSKPAGRPMAATFSADTGGGATRIAELAVELDDVHLRADGNVRSSEPSRYDIHVTSEPADVASLARLLPALANSGIEAGSAGLDLRVKRGASDERPVIAGTVITDRLRVVRAPLPSIDDVSARFTFTDDAIEVAPAWATIGGTGRATLAGRLDGFDAPVTTITMAADSLPLSALGVVDRPAGTGGFEGASEGESERDQLRDVSVQAIVRPGDEGSIVEATVASGSGRIHECDYAGLSARVRHDGRITQVSDVELEAFDGKLSGSGKLVVDGRGERHFDAALAARGIRYAQAAQRLSPGSSRALDGYVDAYLQVAGSGNEWLVVRDRLEGTADVRIRDGRLVNMNVAEDLLRGMTGIPRLSSLLSDRLASQHPWLFGHTGTDFETLAATFRIAGGEIKTDDLTVMTRDYGVAAAGRIGFDRSVDLEGFFEASDRLTANLVADVGALRYLDNDQGRIVIPFEVVGTLSDTNAKADMAYVSAAVGRAVVGGIARGVSGLAVGLGRLADELGGAPD